MIRVENVRKVALAAIPIALILAACSSGATPEQTVVVITETPAATELPAELPTAVPIAPTPGSGDPTLIAKVNTAVRSGPGTNYPVYAFMSGGQAATLAGTNESGSHYAVVVTVASTGTGWIDAQFADVRNAGDLAVIEAPPPPPTTSFQPPHQVSRRWWLGNRYLYERARVSNIRPTELLKRAHAVGFSVSTRRFNGLLSASILR